MKWAYLADKSIEEVEEVEAFRTRRVAINVTKPNKERKQGGKTPKGAGWKDRLPQTLTP